MNWCLLLGLFFLFSCAHEDVARAPASEAELIQFGDFDTKKSTVKMFPPQFEGEIIRHYYYVELKDESSKYIDRDDHEFEIREGKKKLSIKVKRVLRGRYYLIHETNKNRKEKNLDFYVANFKLRESFRTGLRLPHASHTTMKILRKTKSRVKIQLLLKDDKGQLVETPEAPEFIPDAEVQIEKVEHMGNGNWQVTLKYPEGNHLFYTSVRSQGVYFKNLFRYQHIHK